MPYISDYEQISTKLSGIVLPTRQQRFGEKYVKICYPLMGGLLPPISLKPYNSGNYERISTKLSGIVLPTKQQCFGEKYVKICYPLMGGPCPQFLKALYLWQLGMDVYETFRTCSPNLPTTTWIKNVKICYPLAGSPAPPIFINALYLWQL